MEKQLTVRDLRKTLEKADDSIEITFGSSPTTKRAITMYRFKQRGEDLLQIELRELHEADKESFEHEERWTVGRFLNQLKIWDDSCEVIFSATQDTSELGLLEIKETVSFDMVLI